MTAAAVNAGGVPGSRTRIRFITVSSLSTVQTLSLALACRAYVAHPITVIAYLDPGNVESYLVSHLIKRDAFGKRLTGYLNENRRRGDSAQLAVDPDPDPLRRLVLMIL